MTASLHANYLTLIADFDKTIGMVRTMWMEAKDDAERAKMKTRLNELLDERLNLMRGRDAAAQV